MGDGWGSSESIPNPLHQSSPSNHRPLSIPASMGNPPTMNREMKKTLGFVAVAAVLITGAAIVDRGDRSSRREPCNDQGQKFLYDFDPNTCSSLAVFSYG